MINHKQIRPDQTDDAQEIYRHLGHPETWLDNSWTDNELVITGYNLFSRDRKTAQGGGVIVYTHNSLSAERRSDLESEQIELISIEFKQFRCAPILLSCFYRPPDSTVSFFDSFANIVDSMAAENKKVHIVGDFNVDLIKKSTNTSFNGISRFSANG